MRGKESPTEITKKYQIGLARLYKIWTDASNDKKFPGGFTGTVSGKNLTSNIESINAEIHLRRIEYEKLNKQLNDYNNAIKVSNETIKKDKRYLFRYVGKS